jgi:xanthine dehydrogenase accessory factor
MSNRFLIRQFNQWQETDTALVLATVVHTEGSTYSKAGRHILIRESGEHAGLISGGCLEGDLAEQARDVFETGMAQTITYDMRDAADDIWGIGLGCNGMMQVLLQRLNNDNDWQPFAALAAAMSRVAASTAALITASNAAELPAGACFVDAGGGNWESTTTSANAPDYPMAGEALPAVLPAIVEREGSADCSVLHWHIQPWPRVLLLGAGPDAIPVAQLAAILGWEVTVADHRPHYIETGRFTMADNLALVEANRINAMLPMDHYSAVVVMSHHLETDRHYLRQLSVSPLSTRSYIGILGPAARRKKLLSELDLTDTDFAERLHGPVGVDLGGDSPEAIALSLISEIQSVSNRV